MERVIKPADFQALQLLVISISQHLSVTSPQYRPLISAITRAMEQGIPLAHIDAILADHYTAELQESWEWLLQRAVPK